MKKLMVRSQPFCINVGLSEEVRATYAARMVDSNSPGHHTPLAEILGIANANEVQTSITRMCRQFSAATRYRYWRAFAGDVPGN